MYHTTRLPEIHLIQKHLYPYEIAVEDPDIFDGNLPATQDDTSDEEPEE